MPGIRIPKLKDGIPKELRSALSDSLTIQIFLGVLVGLMMDNSIFLHFWLFSMAAFWGGCMTVLIGVGSMGSGEYGVRVKTISIMELACGRPISFYSDPILLAQEGR